jgi:hypothetical protein
VLLEHQARVDRSGGLQQPIGERRLAVIDVSDDAKVSDS